MKRKASAPTLISLLLTSLLLFASIPPLKASNEPPQMQWEKNLGPMIGNSVLQTADGSIIVSATTGEYVPSNGGYHKNLQSELLKVNLNGEIQWEKTYSYYMPFSGPMIQTRDGGYAIAGTLIIELPPRTGNWADYGWLTKTDSEGNMQWNATFPQSIGSAEISTIVQTQDGGYLMGGCYNPEFEGSQAAWIIKTDSECVIEWSKTYDGIVGALSLIENADGNIILSGYVQGQANYEACLSELDENGNIQWTKTYDNHNYGISLLKKKEGYILSGGSSFFVMETDFSGNVTWDKTYSMENSVSKLVGLAVLTEDGYLFPGTYGEEGFLIKTDFDGNIEWNASYAGSGWASINAVCQINGGGYVFTGSTGTLPRLFGHYEVYVWLVKLAPESVNPTPTPTNEALPPPFSTTVAVVIAVIILVTVITVLLVYFKKRKH